MIGSPSLDLGDGNRLPLEKCNWDQTNQLLGILITKANAVMALGKDASVFNSWINMAQERLYLYSEGILEDPAPKKKTFDSSILDD